MFTGRQIDLETGYFAKTKNRDFNKENSSKTVSEWREKFADIANKHLARAGYLFVEVDHRSYAEQNNGLEATTHEGYKVTQLRRQGIDTEISLSNDAIKARNAEQHLPQPIDGLDAEIIATEQLLAKLQKQQTLDTLKTLSENFKNKTNAPTDPQQKTLSAKEMLESLAKKFEQSQRDPPEKDKDRGGR